MSELCSILSFGAGGSTKMVEPGTNHIERVFNLKYPAEYTQRPEKSLQNQAAFAEFYCKIHPGSMNAALAAGRVIYGTWL